MSDSSSGEPEESEVVGNTYCTHCKEDLGIPKYYEAHFRRSHAELLHLCPGKNKDGSVCGKTFMSPRGLTNHFGQSHTVRDILCTIAGCRSSFKANEGLAQHLTGHKNRPFFHEKCQKKFITQKELDDHTCYKADDIGYIEAPDEDQARPWKCQHCGFTCPKEREIKKHVQIHTGFKCKDCPGQTFASNNILRKHRKDMHTVVRVTCQKCGTGFDHASRLKRHKCGADQSRKQTKGTLPVVSSTNDASKMILDIGSPSFVQDQNPSNTLTPLSAIASTPIVKQAEEMKGDPPSQPVTMEDMYGDEAHQRARMKLELVQGRLQQSLTHGNTIETLSPLQVTVLGKNLVKYRDAQYYDPSMKLGNPVKEAVSENLRQFLSTPRRRRLYTTYFLDTQTKNPTFVSVSNYSGDKKIVENHERYSVKIGDWGHDLSVAKEFVRHLALILEQVPTFLRLLSDRQKEWASTAALKLTFDANPQFKLPITRPHYRTVGDSRVGQVPRSFNVLINGYEPERNHSWRLRICVPLGNLNQQKKIDVTILKRVEWTGEISTMSLTNGEVSPQQFAVGKLLAEFLAARTFGYIGTEDACFNESATVIRDHWATKNYSQCPSFRQTSSILPWQGQCFFTIKRTTNKHILIKPTLLFANSMKGAPHDILLDRNDPEKINPVLQDMLEALKNGSDADEVWGIGAARADYENDNPYDDLPVISCNITDPMHAQELHICPQCNSLVPYRSMKQIQKFSTYKICSACWEKWDVGASDKKLHGGVIGYHLYRLLLKENEHVLVPKTTAELHQEQHTIWRYLMSKYRRSGEQFEDIYVDQLLNEFGARAYAWDGTRLNPLYPSIEAIDPVTRGPNGATGYHVQTNIAITSDSINRGKKHFPSIVLYAIRLIYEALSSGSQDVYESAIGIFRIALVNHYAYGQLGQVHQTARIGKPVPANFDQILRSFRLPILLDQTVPNEHLYRYVSQKLPGRQADRIKWKHKHHDWLYAQLEMIAIRVFGPDYESSLRKLWLRRDKSGKDVFFPFSGYSIVCDWSEWDLFNFLAVRAHRNQFICQAPHARINPIRHYSVEELLLTIMNLWLRMLRKDLLRSVPQYACGMDEAKLVPMATINDLQCGSIGHRWPGKEEELGLIGFDLDSTVEVTFDADKCGMCWETQYCNFLKFKYAVESLPTHVFPQLEMFRGQNSEILPTGLYDIKLDVVPDPFKLQTIDKTGNLLVPPRFDQDDAEDIQSEMRLKYLQGPEQPSSRIIDETDEFGDMDLEDADLILALETNAQNITDRRNMRNMGASCYADSVIQMMCNTSEFSHLILAKLQIKVPSGRPPTVLGRYLDVDGKKHMDLYHCLSQICQNVLGTGEPITQEECGTLLKSITVLKKEFDMTIQNEAASFFNWLHDTLDTISDHSVHHIKEDIFQKRGDGTFEIRHAHTPLEVAEMRHQMTIEKGGDDGALEDFVKSHWQAYLESGHKSPLIELSTVQVASLWQCCHPDCPTIERHVSHQPSVLLRLDPAVQHYELDHPVSLQELIHHNFQETFSKKSDGVIVGQDQARPCPNAVHKTSRDQKGEYTRKVMQVTRAPQIFVVELNRENLDYTLNIREPHMQRIANYRQFNIRDFSDDAPQLDFEGKKRRDRNIIESPDWDYTVIAMVAYSDVQKHFVSFVKRDDDRWMYFNDLDAQPVYRDPFSDWPESFVENLLCYRRIGSDSNIAATMLSTTASTADRLTVMSSDTEDDQKDIKTMYEELVISHHALKKQLENSKAQLQKSKDQLKISMDDRQKLMDIADTKRQDLSVTNIKKALQEMPRQAARDFMTELSSWYNAPTAGRDSTAITSGEEISPRKIGNKIRRFSNDALSKFLGSRKPEIRVENDRYDRPPTPDSLDRSDLASPPGSTEGKKGVLRKATNRLSAHIGSKKLSKSTDQAVKLDEPLQRDSSSSSPGFEPLPRALTKTPTRAPHSIKRTQDGDYSHQIVPQKRGSLGRDSESKRSRTSLSAITDHDHGSSQSITSVFIKTDQNLSVSTASNTGHGLDDPFVSGVKSQRPRVLKPAGLSRSRGLMNLSSVSLPMPATSEPRTKVQGSKRFSKLIQSGKSNFNTMRDAIVIASSGDEQDDKQSDRDRRKDEKDAEKKKRTRD